VEAIEAAVAALAAGVAAWRAEFDAQTALLRAVPGQDSRSIPDLPIEDLARDLRRAVEGGVPAPLPRPSPAPSPSALDDADKQPDGSAGVVFEAIG